MAASPGVYRRSFGGLPEELTDYSAAKVAVLPVPYEATASYRSGTRLGPTAIIEASANMELMDEEFFVDHSECGIATLPPMTPEMSGPEQNCRQVYEQTKQLYDDGKLPLILGGEHSITIGSFAAALEKHPQASILQIDAHLDLRREYEGSMYNHACVMHHFISRCPVSQVGIRSFSREELDLVRRRGLKPIWARTVLEDPTWIEQALHNLTEEVYVTIDLDGIDPAQMPAVGTPEPGGIGYYDVLDLLKGIAAHRRIIGMDVVELSPISATVAPDFLAAKLAYRALGLMVASPGKPGD